MLNDDTLPACAQCGKPADVGVHQSEYAGKIEGVHEYVAPGLVTTADEAEIDAEIAKATPANITHSNLPGIGEAEQAAADAGATAALDAAAVAGEMAPALHAAAELEEANLEAPDPSAEPSPDIVRASEHLAKEFEAMSEQTRAVFLATELGWAYLFTEQGKAWLTTDAGKFWLARPVGHQFAKYRAKVERGELG